jgi:hypothetical protein
VTFLVFTHAAEP